MSEEATEERVAQARAMQEKGITQEELSAAQRMCDAVNLHVHVGNATGDRMAGFVAINLSDGRSPDGVLYDNRRDAVRHNRDDPYRFYVKVGVEMMPVREALIVLQMARMAFKRGVIFADEEVIAPQLPELMGGFIPRTLHATGAVPSNRRERRHPGLYLPRN